MSNIFNSSPCLFYDKDNHTWKFYVKNSGELMYSIMYEENKWTKENKIDNEVLDFTVNVDSEYKVYIIYCIKGGELKYCIWENNQWFGKTLYRFEKPGYQMREISVNVIGKYTYIFFMARNSGEKKQWTLMHLCLSNEENYSKALYNIPFIQEAYSHYQTVELNNGILYLLFIDKEENSLVIKFTEYKNQKWSVPKRLYGITGNNLDFCAIEYMGKISLLNLSMDKSIYSLEHVFIETDGRIKMDNIYEGPAQPANYSIFEIDKVLWAMWSENDNVLFSSYKGEWSEPAIYDIESNNLITTYKYLSLNAEYKNLEAKYVIGTEPPEIKLLLPEYKKITYKDESKVNHEENTGIPLQVENTEDEFSILKRENADLEKKLLNLQLQLQQKQRVIEESEVNFLKLTNAKKKSEEKLNIIADIQQASIKELEIAKKQKLAMDDVVSELKDKFEDLRSENDQLKIQFNYERSLGIVDRILKKRFEK